MMDDFNFDDYVGINDSSNTSPPLWMSTIPAQTRDQVSPPVRRVSRSHRPRNPKSCDFCRARKTACRVESNPPCAACRSLGRDCTFAERRRKRKRHDANAPHPTRTHEQPSPRDTRKSVSSRSDSSVEDPGLPLLVSSVQRPPSVEPNINDNILRGVNYSQPDRAMGVKEFAPYAHSMDDSLDSHPTATAFLLGDTGESDPYLLRHSSLASHDPNLATKISYRQVHRDQSLLDDNIIDNYRPLVFMIENHSLHDKYEPRVDDEALRKARAELEDICSEEVGVRLVKLYFRYVYPYFPILSRSETLLSEPGISTRIKAFPLSLKAVLYATGLPFMVYDDVLSTTLDITVPSPHVLYRICWLAITHEIHTPHLSTLQSCLLLLQRVRDDRYVMDSPFGWSLLAWTVSLAQSLGLSTDCSTWQGIPAWEKRLRRRLWWATYVMDKWSFMSAGLSPHIKNEDFDVLQLTSTDFISSDTESLASNQAVQDDTLCENSHFYHLVKLTIILSDIIDSYFTIRASKLTVSNFALALELAKPIRSRLHAWKESFNNFISLEQHDSKPHARLDGNTSLGIAYPVASMILFRALLRPLESSGGTLEDKIMRENGREAVRVGAKACCVEVVQYLEQVKRGVWDAFWHSWSRAGFAIASSFMMRLLITSTSSAEISEFNGLITRWRWAMRTGGGNAGNVLMSLGLLRLDRSLLKSGIREPDEER